MIETKIEGEVAAVRSAATWLRGTLAPNLDTAGDKQGAARVKAAGGWDGSAATAYQDFTKTVLSATDKHTARVKRAATACDDYAARLEEAKTTMRGIRTRAVAGGLTVDGTVIQAPPDVPAGVVEAGSPEEAARETAIAKVTLYNTLAQDATTGHENFALWVETNMPADVADAEDKDGLGALASVAVGWAKNAGAGMAGVALTKLAKDMREEGLKYRLKARRSGNPAYRPPKNPEDLLHRSRLLGKWGGRFLGPIGIGVDVFFGIQEARETGDWGRAATTTGTSIVVGGLATAGIIALGGPVILAVGGGALIAYGASELAGYVWDHKDEIAGWVGDRWDDASSAVSEGWDNATDAISDGWDAVTPW